MARLARIVVPGQPLHIVQRGTNRQPTFFADEDYQRYLDDLAEAGRRFQCAIHAHVFMTNHVHLLVTPQSCSGPSRLMQALGRHYVRYVDSVCRRTGTFWEDRFKSALVDSEHYLLTCYRYIELNPVRAGMVVHPGGYRWSSYHRNALGKPHALVTPHPLYQNLGPDEAARCTAYRRFVDESMSEAEHTDIREATEQGTVVGGKKRGRRRASPTPACGIGPQARSDNR